MLALIVIATLLLMIPLVKMMVEGIWQMWREAFGDADKRILKDMKAGIDQPFRHLEPLNDTAKAACLAFVIQWFRLDDMHEAAAEAQRRLEALDPNKMSVEQRVQLAQDAGELERALNEALAGLEAHSRNVYLRCTAAEVYIELGQPQQALELLQAGNPDDPWILIGRIRTLVALDRPADALRLHGKGMEAVQFDTSLQEGWDPGAIDVMRTLGLQIVVDQG